MSAVNADALDIERIIPLLKAVLSEESDEVIWDKVYAVVTESTPPPCLASSFQQTPWLRNTSSFANSTEHRKYVDDVLKEELGPMYVGVPGFSEAFFGKVAGLGPAAQGRVGEVQRRGWFALSRRGRLAKLAWRCERNGCLELVCTAHGPAPRLCRRGSTGFRSSTTTAGTAPSPFARLHGRSQVGRWLRRRSECRRGLQMSLVADPHTRRTQEQLISRHTLQSRARPREICERGARRSRQSSIRAWLYFVRIAHATVGIRPTGRDCIRTVWYQSRRAAVCVRSARLSLDGWGTAWIWPYHPPSGGETIYRDWT